MFISCFWSVLVVAVAIGSITVILKGFALCPFVTEIILSDILVTLYGPSQLFEFPDIRGRHHMAVLDTLSLAEV